MANAFWRHYLEHFLWKSYIWLGILSRIRMTAILMSRHKFMSTVPTPVKEKLVDSSKTGLQVGDTLELPWSHTTPIEGTAYRATCRSKVLGMLKISNCGPCGRYYVLNIYIVHVQTINMVPNLNKYFYCSLKTYTFSHM